MFVSRALLAGAATGIALGLASAWFVPARAAAIPGLYNTGLDQNGALLAPGNGQADPHYLVVETGQQAVTYIHPFYAPEDADSRWLSTSATGGVGNSVMTYRLTFSLDGLDAATAQITGKVGADNLVDIILNGAVGAQVVGFSALAGFTLDSGFVAGLNTLDFRVTDQGYPTALRVDDLIGTAASTQPPTTTVAEPASWAAMLAGLFGIAGFLRRRAGTAPAAGASPASPAGPYAADQHCPGDGLIPRAPRFSRTARPTAGAMDWPFPDLQGRGWG